MSPGLLIVYALGVDLTAVLAREHLRSLNGSLERARTTAEATRAAVDGLLAVQHLESVRLARALLPSLEPARLDALADALAVPLLSGAAVKERFEKKRAELVGSLDTRTVTPEQLRAAEEGRRVVEQSTKNARDAVSNRERALREGERSEGRGIAGVLSALGRKRAPSTPTADPELARLRQELTILEEEARETAAEVAKMRKRQALHTQAQAALAALPHELLSAVRAEVASAALAAHAAKLVELVPLADGARPEPLLFARARHRYAVGVAASLVETPFLELEELRADAQRWLDGVLEGGLMPPEASYAEARVRETTTRVEGQLARAARILLRLDNAVLPSGIDASRGEPVWWSVLFGDGADNGDFLEELRPRPSAPAQRELAPAGAAVDGTGHIATGPASVASGAGGELLGGAKLEEVDFDTARWIERFYGDAKGAAVFDRFSEHAQEGTAVTSEDPTALRQRLGETSTDGVFSSLEDVLHTIASGSAREPSASGTELGGYRLVRRLGVGGMAEVHEATRLADGASVVVKLIQPTWAQDPTYIAMFEREARIGQELDHEHIVRTLGLEIVDGRRFIVMELVRGLSVHRFLSRLWASGGACSVAEAAVVVHDAARALAHAHGLGTAPGAVPRTGGIVHRDISPDNLMVTRDGVVKLTDFGIARGGMELTLTRTGEIKGKLPFMAPELFEGAPPAPAVDIFALGVCFFWLLTQRRPFVGANEGALIRAIMSERAEPPGEIVDGIPPDLDRLVLQMLAKHAEDRPSADVIAETLAPLIGTARETMAARVRNVLGD